MMRRFGVIGASLAYSFSPAYFREKFSALGISDCLYEVFELDKIQQVSDLITKNDLKGINVTIPFKTDILPYLQALDPEAEAIGAVNCVAVTSLGLIGYNTDAHGFRTALKQLTGDTVLRKAIILGDGGAARAVKYVLQQKGIDFMVVSRSTGHSYRDLSASAVREASLLVNTTPLGMYPDVHSYPDIPYEAVHAGHFVMDLVYNPAESSFMRKCALAGATTMNGMVMLRAQADKSWEIWNQESA